MTELLHQTEPMKSLSAGNLTRSQAPLADADGYMNVNRRLRWSFFVMTLMWLFATLIFWFASHRTFQTARQSETVPWLSVPEINSADVPVNVTTLLLLVASLNVALVVSEFSAPAMKTAYQARWAEVIEYVNFGAAVFSLVMSTTVFFWNFHTFVLCAPLSTLTVILAASAYQRSGGYLHRLAFEKIKAEGALRSINARLSEGDHTRGYTWKGLAWSSFIIVIAPAAVVLVIQLLLWVLRADDPWRLGATPAVATSLASLTLATTRTLTIGQWETNRRFGAVGGWFIGGAVALLIGLTPVTLAAEVAGGSVFVLVLVVPLMLHVYCFVAWRAASAGPWRILHQLCRRYAAANVRTARKAFETALTAYRDH